MLSIGFLLYGDSDIGTNAFISYPGKIDPFRAEGHMRQMWQVIKMLLALNIAQRNEAIALVHMGSCADSVQRMLDPSTTRISFCMARISLVV